MTHAITRKVLIAGAALTAALGIGGVAHAATTPSTPPAATQSGAAGQHSSVSGTPSAGSIGQGGGSASQQESASEQSSPQDPGEHASHEADGPGGHADPAGNVNHQFNGVE